MITNFMHSNEYTPAPVGNETAFTHCNFSHSNPRWDGSNWVGWQIFSGNNVPMYFFRCNLMNVEVPPGSITEKCLTVVKQTDIVLSSDTLTITTATGDTVMTVETNGDEIYGRQVSGGTYEYWTPQVIPNPDRRLD